MNNAKGMRTRIVMVGRTERGFVHDGVTHYLGRVGVWSPVKEVVVPASGHRDPAIQRQEEARGLLKALDGPGRVVALDEVGQAMSSRAFAQRLGRWRDESVREVTFVIGGAYGLADEVRARADLVLSLSLMTFPHQLVRLLFAEQLYRAHAILHGSGYHH